MPLAGLRFLALALLAFVFFPGPSAAESISNLDELSADGAGPSYRQLVLSVFKDAKENEAGELVTQNEKILRKPGVKERTTLSEGSILKYFDFIRVREADKPYLVLFIQAETPEYSGPDSGAAVMASFPWGGSEPVDVEDVKSDVFAYLHLQKELISLGQDDAFLVSNYHSNSNQNYHDTSLFFLRQGRFRRIAQVFTLSLRGMCEKSFTQTLSWKTKDRPGSPCPDVEASVALAFGASGQDAEGCPKRGKAKPAKTFTQVYAYDKAGQKYLAKGNAFAELDKLNEASF